MKTVLIVTHEQGFESDPVIDAIRNRGVEVFRFNTDGGENISHASFWSGLKKDTVEVEFECDNRRVCSSDIGVGWCQQLPPYFDQPIGEMECLQSQNLWALHSALFEFLPISWLNKPSSVVYASNKILQLALAQRIGLTIPRTIVSNQPDQVLHFAVSQTIVAKNLATPWITRNEGMQAAYTRIVRNDWLTERAIAFCPIIYQRYHKRRRDYRVIVVGEQVFAAFCVPREHQQEDIRKGVGTGELFSACNFDKETLGKLTILMRELSVEYCAADFMEDINGNLYFLEMNTCGAWWWLDHLYDGAICTAVTDFLVRLNSLSIQ